MLEYCEVWCISQSVEVRHNRFYKWIKSVHEWSQSKSLDENGKSFGVLKKYSKLHSQKYWKDIFIENGLLENEVKSLSKYVYTLGRGTVSLRYSKKDMYG